MNQYSSGTFWSVAQSGAPPAAAEKVEVRAHLRQRVPRRINALNPWDGIEDDLPLLRRLIIHAGRQSNCAEGNLGATGGPGCAGVGDVIFEFGHLDKDSELNRLPGKPRAEFVEQKARIILICFQVECNYPRPCGDTAHANTISRQTDET